MYIHRGHALGDTAAFTISRLLQMNNTMKGIRFDCNGTTLKGLEEISKQIVRGITLTEISLPIVDISKQFSMLSKSTDIERLKDVSAEIEEKLRFFTQLNVPDAAADLAPISPRSVPPPKQELSPRCPVSVITTGKSVPVVCMPPKPHQEPIQLPGKFQSLDYLAKKYPEIEAVQPAGDDVIESTGLFRQLSSGLLCAEDML